ncbi:uncharacterized protein LOC143368024 isoform X6 [Andrena cerasifolii]|uniref:uncharacterized protein LOC143368024 isoform X6 n=1 Tax=Andrena cerasifolii TaxID=2819439 RepID=UPI004037A729
MSNKLKCISIKIILVLCTLGTIKCHNVPCTFNTMCMCWVQDDQDFTKMDISCMGTPFARFPDLSEKYVTQLDVVGSGMQALDNDALPSSVGVEALGLMSNQLASIGDKSFSGIADSLRSLDLSYNSLEDVPLKAFRDLRKLNWLNMHSNHLTSLDGDWGHMKETLTNAFFGDNSIIDIPKLFSTFGSLVWLNLDNNNIEELSEDSLPPNMHTLSLNNNLLKSFPSSLKTLKGLRWLYLRGNDFKSLELPDFKSLNLELVDVSENCIEWIRASSLTNRTLKIRDFNLDNNKLSSLTAGTFDRLDIKRIHLSSNSIKNVDNDAFRELEDTLEYLNLENNELPSVPGAVSRLKKLSYLYLANNDIKNISGDTFQEFAENLRALSLATNNLDAIPVAALSGCQRLLHLNLGYNKISHIQSGDFEWAEDLEILLLRNNILTKLKRETFKGAKFNKLTTLDLDAISEIGGPDFALNVSYNAISLINSGGSMNNLTRLDLSFNNISHLPADTFYDMPDLKSLNLRSNFITVLESGTFGLSHLETLNLQDNKIENLRKQSFHGLESLQQLDLNENQISQLSVKQFQNLRKLRLLNLSSNKIRSLPKDVFEGTKLEILDLSHNKLTVVPSPSFLEVGSNLRNLNLADNFVDHLDSTAFPTSQLVSLNLAHNRLTILPDNSFVSLGKLLSLNVSQNILQANFKELFHYLPDLRRLYLASCGLRDIPLLPLTNLNILDLSLNHIDTTSDKQFQYLKDLRILVLVNNTLSFMPNVKLNLLREFDISGNPIQELTKESFTGYPRLEKLNLKNLNKTKSVDRDCLRVLKYLKHLRIQTWPEADGFHLRHLLTGLPLRTVEIQITEHLLKHQIQNAFTKQLRELTISGSDLEVISSEAFSTIEGGELILRIKNTQVRRLQSDIFLPLTKRLSQLTLDLRNNHINELSPSVIYGNLSWESVGTNMVAGGLQVSGNPLECDCEIAWLSLWLRRWLRESRQIHTASQSDARQLRTIAGRAVCTETTPSYSSDKVLLTLGTPHTACQASALSSGNYEKLATTWLAIVDVIFLTIIFN